WCNQSARTWTRGPTRNDNSTFGNIHLPLFIDSRILPNSKRHYSQISCGFDLDYRPGYSILLRISHNLGFEDIDFYCHSKLSSRDVNPILCSPPGGGTRTVRANWIEEQLEMCHDWLIDGSVGISLLALKNDMMERLAGPGMDALRQIFNLTQIKTLSFIISYEYVPSCPELQCRSLNSGQPGCQNISVSSMRLEAQLARTPESRAAAASDCKWNIPTSTEDAAGHGPRIELLASGAWSCLTLISAVPSPEGSRGRRRHQESFVICGDYSSSSRVLYMALTADLPDIQISYSAIETGINVSVTFIDCKPECQPQTVPHGQDSGGLVFLAIVLTLLLLGCLLFINREAVGSRVHAVLQLRQSRTEDTLQLTRETASKIRPTSAHRSGEEMSRTPATGCAQAGRKSRRLVRQRDIEQSQQHSTEERLARPLTRQRGEEAEVADVDFVLQEAPQRIVVRVSLVTLVCCGQKTVWSYRTHGLSRLGQTDLLLLLEHIAIDNAAPADPVALFAGVLKKAKEGSTVGDMDHTVFQASERGFLGSQYTGGVLAFHGLVHPADFGSLLACRLVHRRELPYLLHSPTRLLLRLGAEDGVYPCGLISNRYRPPVFYEPARSVMSMFREAVPHLSEGLVPRLRDCNLTLESNGIVVVSISGRRQADLASLLSVYAPDTDGVLALAGELCQSADAHLVARESPGGEFETVLFSAAGRPQIWPAGGLPATAGVSVGADQQGCLAAIVEDGLGVICSRQDMWSLLQSLNEAEDFVLPLDWLFLHDRREPMRSSSIRFVWRHLPGE
uniref:DUF3480 domain-containing protein n=1 Tax=Macrostomum lignano TaxID=282301 RepID=A0A1I8F2S8_9PLAT